MYGVIAQKGVDGARRLYNADGQRVIDVYASGTAAGLSKAEIKSRMEAEINSVKAQNPGAFKHTGDRVFLEAIDVAPSSISSDKKAGFEDQLKSDPAISKVLTPPTDPAIHIEIPQRPKVDPPCTGKGSCPGNG
jgi:hypothetical protein